jgi:riboflavin synthase
VEPFNHKSNVTTPTISRITFHILMFTGLVEEIGRVVALDAIDHRTRLRIAAPRMAAEVKIGESIALNGCCLTLASRRRDRLSFDLLQETIARTNLNDLRQNSPVNLERALRADGRLGGHFVQGHVDCVAPIIAFDTKGADFRLEVELPENSRHYVAYKGSIAVNGISLTVAEVLPTSFAVWIIPYTKRHTNLDRATTGDLVNLEFDVVAKYVERMVAPSVTKK